MPFTGFFHGPGASEMGRRYSIKMEKRRKSCLICEKKLNYSKRGNVKKSMGVTCGGACARMYRRILNHLRDNVSVMERKLKLLNSRKEIK